uniref:(northern house mosquito) hypothetical protein n=1 Tax=Culex pipiens TaxID=7175 RepID=A0A8D8BB95_CULPI
MSSGFPEITHEKLPDRSGCSRASLQAGHPGRAGGGGPEPAGRSVPGVDRHQPDVRIERWRPDAQSDLVAGARPAGRLLYDPAGRHRQERPLPGEAEPGRSPHDLYVPSKQRTRGATTLQHRQVGHEVATAVHHDAGPPGHVDGRHQDAGILSDGRKPARAEHLLDQGHIHHPGLVANDIQRWERDRVGAGVRARTGR